MSDEGVVAVPARWTHIGEALPPVGTWCWVSDGVEVWLAKRDLRASGGWSNEDTWEDATNRVRYWQLANPPQPPA